MKPMVADKHTCYQIYIKTNINLYIQAHTCKITHNTSSII